VTQIKSNNANIPLPMLSELLNIKCKHTRQNDERKASQKHQLTQSSVSNRQMYQKRQNIKQKIEEEIKREVRALTVQRLNKARLPAFIIKSL